MKRASLVFSVCYTIVGSLSFSAVRAMGDEELLQLVRDAHRAARESIQTFSGQVEVEMTMYDAKGSKPPDKHTCSGRFWFSQKTMRSQVSEHNENIDSLWDNSVRKYVVRKQISGKLAASAGRDRFTHRHSVRCDPFARALLVFNPPPISDWVPFEELVDRATKLQKIERKQVGGRELIMVQLFFDKSARHPPPTNIEIYFDPAVNYLVRRITVTFLTSNYRSDNEVLEFKEHKPGLFFPEHLVGSGWLPNKVKHNDSTTRFSEVQINQPLPRDIFNFKYPHGVSLRDNILGSEYRVDADGNPISQQIPYVHEPPPPGNPQDSKQDFGTETQEEPRPLSRWILPLSFGIVIAGGVAAFLRRRRRQAESA